MADATCKHCGALLNRKFMRRDGRIICGACGQVSDAPAAWQTTPGGAPAPAASEDVASVRPDAEEVTGIAADDQSPVTEAAGKAAAFEGVERRGRGSEGVPLRTSPEEAASEAGSQAKTASGQKLKLLLHGSEITSSANEGGDFEPVRISEVFQALQRIHARVLVVDDDSAIVRLMVSSLPRDYVVKTAGSAYEAERVLKTFSPEIILLDIHLPGMDGIEFLDTIRSYPQFEFTRIIIVSGDSRDQARIEAYECGADDFVAKPFSFEELKLKVERWVRFTRFEELGQLRTEFVELVGNHYNYTSPFSDISQALRGIETCPEAMADPQVVSAVRLIRHKSEDYVKRYLLLQDYIGCRCQTYPLTVTTTTIDDITGRFVRSWQRECEEAGLTLEFAGDHGETPVRVDLSIIKRVLRWLFRNSWEWAISRITVETGMQEDERCFLDLLDDGTGFDANLIDIVFDGFRVGRQLLAPEEIGLHLSMARVFMQIQGGDVVVQNPGPGETRVRVLFEVSHDQVATSAPEGTEDSTLNF